MYGYLLLKKYLNSFLIKDQESGVLGDSEIALIPSVNFLLVRGLLLFSAI
jgi:hypothetical protein